MREGGEPNTPLTALVGVVFAIVLFVVVVFLQAYFYQEEQAEDARKVVAVAPEELSQLRAQQLATLHGYRWVDPKEGVVAIPIGRAMEQVVQDGGKSPWPSVQPPPPGPPPTPPPHPAVPKR